MLYNNDCLKVFTRKFNCNRHMQNCKQKLKNEIQNLKKEIKENKNEVNVQNINIQNNYIFINDFNERDTSTLTNKIMKSFISGDEMKCISNLVKFLHFNKNLPENHNMYISDLNRNIAKIYNGNKWESVKSSETIDKIIDSIEIIIVEWLDELDDKKLHKDMEFQFNSYNNRKETEIKELINEIKLVMYNHRDVILDTIKKQNIDGSITIFDS